MNRFTNRDASWRPAARTARRLQGAEKWLVQGLAAGLAGDGDGRGDCENVPKGRPQGNEYAVHAREAVSKLSPKLREVQSA